MNDATKKFLEEVFKKVEAAEAEKFAITVNNAIREKLALMVKASIITADDANDFLVYVGATTPPITAPVKATSLVAISDMLNSQTQKNAPIKFEPCSGTRMVSRGC